MKAFELLTSRLDPLCKKLWQIPKEFITWDDAVWYHGGSKNRGLGKNPLGDFMSELSVNANLSKRYTNHSIRAICITILDKCGFEARDIMAVSSHKCEQSIKSYSKTSDEKKRKMSEALSSAIVTTQAKSSKVDESIVTKKECNIAPPTSENNEFETINTDHLGTIRQLLQLTPEQEKEFFHEILTQDIPLPDDNPNGSEKNDEESNKTIEKIENITESKAQSRQERPQMPKMMFANSSVTINFHMK